MISSPSLGLILVLFAISVTLHMVEEVLWLPAWSQDAGIWHKPVQRGAFAIASLLYLLVLYPIVYLGAQSKPEGVAIYLVCCFALIMLVNLFMPHAGAAIAQHRYAPGLATALLLILPSSLMLIYHALNEDYISGFRFGLAGLAALVIAAFAWPWLMKLGAKLTATGRELSIGE